ncbi:MAG: MBL fold metallo-hydrolase [Planctomycetota bacterium]
METDRRTFLAAAGGLAASAALPMDAFASSARRAAPVLPWEEIAPGVVAFVVGPTGGNVIAAKTDGATVVVDTKFPYLAAAIRDDAVAHGGDNLDLLVINTHHHADHTGGNLAFAGRYPVYAHERGVKRVRDQFDRYVQGARAGVKQAVDLMESGQLDADVRKSAEAAAERAERLEPHNFVPTHPVGVPLTQLRRVGVDMHHFGPGHTDNDLVVHLPDRNVVHCGDLVFRGLHPFFDANAGTDPFGWIASLWRIYQLCDSDTVVVPGHGAVGDRTMVRDMIRYHERLIESVTADIDAGVSRDDATKKTYDWMEGIGFAQLRPIAIGVVYDEVTKRR